MAEENDIRPKNLAAAVVHWLELEHLFGRERLLNEDSLKLPIHQFLASNSHLELALEVSFPGLQTDSGHAIDFCLCRRKVKTVTSASGSTPKNTEPAWVHVIESKLVNNKRSFQQEILDDLLRLEWANKENQSEKFFRWLLIAGKTSHIKEKIFEAQTNPGGGGQRVDTFTSILPKNEGDHLNVRIADEAREGFRKKWTASAKALGLTQWPLSFDTKLGGKHEGLNFVCYVWRISSVSKRALKEIT